MGYIIRNTDNGRYVAPSGSHHSYVKRPEDAQLFPTPDAAKANGLCSNEVLMEYIPATLRPVK